MAEIYFAFVFSTSRARSAEITPSRPPSHINFLSSGGSDYPTNILYKTGIDLTTEGVITLRKLIELSEEYIKVDSDEPKRFVRKDGASRLADFLFEEATCVRFFVGQAVNEAHKGLPIDSTLKFKLVEKLSNNLEVMGKKIEIKYY